MNDTPTVPPRIVTLADALAPCLDLLNRRIDAAVAADSFVAEEDVGAWLQAGLNRLQAHIPGMNRQFEQLNREVLGNAAAAETDVYREAGRFEAYLDGFLHDRDSIRRTLLPGDYVEARNLLAGAYRHNLIEIRDWLARFIGVLADPFAEVRRQGLSADGPTQLELTLNMTSAPEIEQLGVWASRKRAKDSKASFWTILGGIALGALFLDGIIDDDCGGCGPDA